MSSHNHGNGHGHSHDHGVVDYNRVFAIGIVLNVVFVIIEVVYGLLTDSLALIADAGHNLSDVVSLLLAWGANALAARSSTERRTYGYRKATVMASLASAVLLLVALGGITMEAIRRFGNPTPVEGMTIVIVAGVGIVINTLTALLFVRGQKHDLNLKGAFLHMAADAGVSLGVVIAGVVILLTGRLWVDPVISLGIVVVILIGTWGLLRDSLNYAMDAVPNGIELSAVREYLHTFDHVNRIHDLHIWPLSTTEVALTVHLVVDDETLDNSFLGNIQKQLHQEFGIGHSTIQVETASGLQECNLDDHIEV
jgi:cobalt-zinc-cadmium efflux system protein